MMRKRTSTFKPHLDQLEDRCCPSIVNPALVFVGPPQLPAGQWMWIIVASMLSTLGTLLFAWAYARGPASYLSVTEYSGFLWAAALGWLVFDEKVSLYTLAGAVMIVAGCLIAARGKVSAPPEIDVDA